MHGIALTPTDDVLIGSLLILLKFIIRPSKIEGQMVLMFIPLLLNVLKRSHGEHIYFIKSIEKQIKILRDKLKGDKMTLG